MPHRKTLAILIVFLTSLTAVAKDKKKPPLPADILQAHTVLVLIDPDAGVDAQDPMANRTARQDVERALAKWGRFSTAMEASNADLVITVRKGNGKIAQGTIGGMPTNNRPITAQSDGSVTQIGGRHGTSADPNDPTNSPSSTDPHPQLEVGSSQDTFVVYRCSKDDPNSSPLDGPAVWRYTARDALESPDVPAVEVFRKLIAQTEKQLANP